MRKARQIGQRSIRIAFDQFKSFGLEGQRGQLCPRVDVFCLEYADAAPLWLHWSPMRFHDLQNQSAKPPTPNLCFAHTKLCWNCAQLDRVWHLSEPFVGSFRGKRQGKRRRHPGWLAASRRLDRGKFSRDFCAHSLIRINRLKGQGSTRVNRVRDQGSTRISRVNEFADDGSTSVSTPRRYPKHSLGGADRDEATRALICEGYEGFVSARLGTPRPPNRTSIRNPACRCTVAEKTCLAPQKGHFPPLKSCAGQTWAGGGTPVFG